MPDWRVVRKNVLVAALTCVAILAVLYAVACGLFAKYERAFVFYRMETPSTPPPAALVGFSEVTIPTEDGERLYGWWKPPQPGHGLIAFLIGTGIKLSDYPEFFADLAAHGFGVVSFDYRGNGASTGAASEAGWRADARAAFDFAHKAAPDAKIAAFGESMGTGLAVGLGVERPVAGVLLNSPYASVAGLYQRGGLPLLHVPFPARRLMSDQLDSEALIGRLRVPVMILHGTADRAIPLDEARRLYAAAHAPKEMIEVPGAGHTAVWFGPTRDRALAALTAWTAPDPAPAVAGRATP